MYIKYTMGSYISTVTAYKNSFVNISENTSINILVPKSSVSTLNISESAHSATTRLRILNENTSIIESTLGAVNRPHYILAGVNIEELTNYVSIYPRHNFDAVNISDNYYYSIYDSKGKSKDTINVGELTTSYIKISRQDVDQVNITENTTGFLRVFKNYSVVETINITDKNNYIIFSPIFKTNNESVNISETKPYLITKYSFEEETINITEILDTVVNTVGVSKSIEHALNIYESTAKTVISYKTGSGNLLYIYNNVSPYVREHHLISFLGVTSTTKKTTVFTSPKTGLNGNSPKVINNYSILDRGSKKITMSTINRGQLQTIPNGASLDYGFIKYPKTYPFTVISGGPEDVTITEIIIPDYFGILVSGIAVGDIVPPGEEVSFNVTATDVGRTNIDGFFTIHFSDGNILRVYVKLTRELVFDLFISPNRKEYNESIVYNTVLFNSINNVVKTKSLMNNYKYECKYSATTPTSLQHRAFLNIFRKALTVPVIQPLWGQTTEVTEYVENAAVIKCVGEYSDFRVGNQVFVFKDADNYHKAFVVAVNAGSLIIDRKMTTKVGWLVVPSFTGIAKGDINTSYSGERAAKVDIQVAEFAPYE